MRGAARLRAALAATVLAVLALTGCVQVPTAGPIEKVPGQAETCENCVNVQVEPPAPGADPGQVVEGFLDAMSNYQPNYATARQFLTEQSAAAWRADAGVTIYEDEATSTEGNGVRLVGQVVGTVEPDRTFTAAQAPLDVRFTLVQERGQWRIDKPQDGLLVTEFSFSRSWNAYSVFFIGNETSLVPERIYLPALRNADTIASALVEALLDGPSKWLAPAVGTTVPSDTALSGGSVTINAEVAEVALTDQVLALPDTQRTRLAGQIVSTLRQLTGLEGVLITVNQQPFQVPGLSDPGSGVIPTGALSPEIDPVPGGTGQLFAVQDGRVHEVLAPDGTPELRPVDGALGDPTKQFRTDALAVSANGTDLAVVTDRGSALRRSVTATGAVSTVRAGLTGLLRPQFTRYNELWALGSAGGRQRFWLSSVENGTVAAPVLDQGVVRAFRISPDGTRMALVRTVGSTQQLGLARIVRAGKITVNGWRTIDIRPQDTEAITQIADVAWIDANDLLVLGRSDSDSPLTTVRVAADASQASVEGGRPDWGARELAVRIRPQTFLVAGQQPGQTAPGTWRRLDGQWLPYLSGATAVAYAG